MRKLWLVSCFATFAAQAALAQTPLPPPHAPSPMKLFAAAPEIPALIAKAKAERKPDQAIVLLPILSLEPYRASLEYRPGNSPPALHEKGAEILYVLEGTATLVTGGKLVDELRVNPNNLFGKSISGGQQQALAKGDFAIVPENTPHQILPTGGEPVTLVSIKVPRPVSEPY